MIDLIIGKEYPAKVIPLIDSAKQSILIMCFDWRFYENSPLQSIQLLNQSIIRAKKRGVEVSALVNFPDSINVFSSIGIKIKQYKKGGILHCKIIIIDDKDVVLGSHNLTQNAMTSNIEVSLLIKNFKEVDRLKKIFNNLSS